MIAVAVNGDGSRCFVLDFETEDYNKWVEKEVQQVISRLFISRYDHRLPITINILKGIKYGPEAEKPASKGRRSKAPAKNRKTVAKLRKHPGT